MTFSWIQALPTFLLCHHLRSFGFCFSSLLPHSPKVAATTSDIISSLHRFMQGNKKQRKQGRVSLIATSVLLSSGEGTWGSFPSHGPSRSHNRLLLSKSLGRGLPALTLLIPTHYLNSKSGVLLTKTDSYGGCVSTSRCAKQPGRKKPGFL